MQFVLWYNSVGGLKMIIEILLFLRSSDLVYNVIWRALKDYDAMNHVLFLKLRNRVVCRAAIMNVILKKVRQFQCQYKVELLKAQSAIQKTIPDTI